VSLRALAAHVGVLTAYTSYRGETVDVSDDTLAAVLAACGVDLSLPPERAAAQYDERTRAHRPVVVAWDGVRPGTEHADEPGARLPFGYHETDDTLVISTPRLAARVAGRHWGVYAPVYALTTARRRDVGDLDALRRLFDWVVSRGGDTVLTLPLLATFPDVASPYSPISRLFWNELHLPIAGAGEPAPDGLVDYPAAFARVHAALRAERAALPPARRDALASFVRSSPRTTDYARFRAMGERYGRDWRRWPGRDAAVDQRVVELHEYAQWRLHEELTQLRDHVAARGGLLGLDLPLGSHPDGYDAWSRPELFVPNVSVGAPPDLFFQSGQNWGFAPQLVPALIASGYDYFIESVRNHLRHATLLRIDHVMQFHRLYWIPDGFAPTEGAYVRYPWEHYLAILCLESHLAGVPIVGENLGIVPPEVDHALESHGLLGTWVAFGSMDGARDGRPLDRPPSWALAAANTHDMPTFRGFVDGADLDVRFTLGLIDHDTLVDLQHARADDIVATEQRLRDAGWLDGHEPASTRDEHVQTTFRALLRSIAASDAPIVLANLEDLWGEAEQQNVPGTSTEQPNWRRVTRVPVDRLDEEPEIAVTAATARRGDGLT
jgi:4-alpha-glucanotransferase